MDKPLRVFLLGVVSLSAINCDLALAAEDNQKRELVVCAAADNLPFSNDKLQGFENKIVELLAKDMRAPVRYAWNDGPRGFRPRMLLSGVCNMVMGVPAGLPGVSITRPYYTSSYVFVTARASRLDLHGFDDPALRNLKIGLQAIGAQGANTPPATALARRGLTGNIVGYSLHDAPYDPGSPAKIVAAVANGEVDTALVWGPLAGYFAKRYDDRLQLTQVDSDPQMPTLPFSFAISLGVSANDETFKAALQSALDRNQAAIQAVLHDYGIPLVRNDKNVLSQ